GANSTNASPPVNPETARSHAAAGHAEGEALRAGSVGVPPVAAGVLRDLHREGTLNGEAANAWGASGDGGRSAASSNPNPSTGQERATSAPPVPPQPVTSAPAQAPAQTATTPAPPPAPPGPAGGA
ncbi:unnamed protein product, partial [Ectocarpus sp. 8 AP-2014]